MGAHSLVDLGCRDFVSEYAVFTQPLSVARVFIYSIAMILMGLLLAVLFRIPEWNGMLYTVFADDLIMAAEFVIAAKKIAPNCKVSIAV